MSVVLNSSLVNIMDIWSVKVILEERNGSWSFVSQHSMSISSATDASVRRERQVRDERPWQTGQCEVCEFRQGPLMFSWASVSEGWWSSRMGAPSISGAHWETNKRIFWRAFLFFCQSNWPFARLSSFAVSNKILLAATAIPLPSHALPGEITNHFWKTDMLISDTSRQKSLQYAFEWYIPDVNVTQNGVNKSYSLQVTG